MFNIDHYFNCWFGALFYLSNIGCSINHPRENTPEKNLLQKITRNAIITRNNQMKR